MTEGTAESEWAGWLQLANLPELPRPTGRILVVSAHPDDEVLGAGGMIASLADGTAELTFVSVTDGEASHPYAAPALSARLPELRSRELGEALGVLGHPAPRITRLGLPDSAVSKHTETLATVLDPHVAMADHVICPSALDGHADHVAVGEVVASLCRGRVPLLQVPIWIWHWTTPAASDVPWHRARRYELSATEQRAKQAAIACFVTQVRAWPPGPSGEIMLPGNVLDHFSRTFEVYFT
jgi:LmbE family N-acetylglucosaminyl deacetylase